MSRVSEYLRKHFDQKQVWIFGVAREGLSSYLILREALGSVQITLVDDKDLSQLGPKVQEFLETDTHLRFYSSQAVTPDKFTPDIVMVKSPGIPNTHPIVSQTLQAGGTVTSNTQLFFESLEYLPQAPLTIGITGTKGKSTTSSMIYHVLKEAGKPVILVGNIGVPPLNAINDLNLEGGEQPLVVLELSSHQLRELTLSPNIAVIQNITPEHLDYYPDFETYRNAKGPITKYQKEKDVVIYCPDFESVNILVAASKAQRLTFAVDPTTPAPLTAYATNQSIFYGSEKVIDVAQVPLLGRHNLYNVLPAVIIGKLIGLEVSQIANAVSSFKGLPHRIEFAGEKNGVRFYNDSQATTPESTIAAMKSFPKGSVHLLAGGSDKGVDLSEFAQEILVQEVKTVLLFPPMGAVIEGLLKEAADQTSKPLPVLHQVGSMKEAVSLAKTAAQPGEVVLLSPACASFGLFKNYQDRGDQFKAAVQDR